MDTVEADEKLRTIEKLAQEIEDDEELKKIDMRYHITAKWIDTDIDTASV